MKLSTRSRYGLRAMVELAVSEGERESGTCIPLRTIAAKHGMSEYYLEQLFAPLKKAGLVASVRGAAGGYRLSRPPESITAGDVPCAAAFCENCNTKSVWERLHAGMNEVLDTIRLSELAAESGRE
jgi:Rrf2 family cysteine metabolism transcriptional repressor